MKKYLIAIIVFAGFLFSSCSSDEGREEINVVDFTLESFPQEWRLVGLEESMLPNAEIQSPENNQMEIYVFGSDNSFTKKKEVNGEEVIVSGVFSLIEDENLLKLTFNDLPESIENNYEIISSCSRSAKTEYFSYDGKLLINNSWAPCDGPYLYFERVAE